MNGDSEGDYRVDEIIAAYNRGELSIGLDLGNGRTLIQSVPAEIWEKQIGPKPHSWASILDILMLASYIGLLCTVVCAFLVWPWYLAIPIAGLTGYSVFGMTGFPHPQPWRYLLLGGISTAFTPFWGIQQLPVDVFLMAVFASHLKYYLVGYWLRRYVSQNPRALASLLAAGFIRIDPEM